MLLAFAFVLALVTGILVGAAPAWLATRTDPVEALRGSGRGTSDHASLAHKALLLVQAALSVVLVAGATMLGRSLNKLENQDFGYEVKRSEEHTSELQSRLHLVCRLLLEKKNKITYQITIA